jgi:hypothetical protein
MCPLLRTADADGALEERLLPQGTDEEPSPSSAPVLQPHQQLIQYQPFFVDAFVNWVVQSWLSFLGEGWPADRRACVRQWWTQASAATPRSTRAGDTHARGVWWCKRRHAQPLLAGAADRRSRRRARPVVGAG